MTLRSPSRPGPLMRGMVCATLLAAACNGGSSSSPGDNSPPTSQSGDGSLGAARPVSAGATQFNSPSDAALSPDASQVYFTAVGAEGPAVFSVAASAGAAPKALASGGPLTAPLAVAVSTDGKTVFVADPAAATANDEGVIFSIPSGGGTPKELSETADYAPRALAVVRVGNADVLYFVGTDKADGSSGIFQDRGGSVSAVVKGDAVGDPRTVAVTSDGTVYFVDGGRGDSARLLKVDGGSARPVGGAAESLRAVSGLEVAQDQKALIAAVGDSAGQATTFVRISPDGTVTKQGATVTAPGGLEPGGLHRAAQRDVYAFADGSAGGSGTVFLISQ